MKKIKQTVYEPSFNPIGHVYMSPDGRILDSVTTVLKLELGLYQYGDNSAAERGTNVHKLTEDLDRGTFDETCGISPRCQNYVSGYLAAKTELGLIPLDIERRLYHPIWSFAGTIDRLAKISGDEWIIDLKTGQKEKWHGLQTAAYAELYQSSFPRRKPRRRGCLYLKADGTYCLTEHTEETDRTYFLALFSAHNTKIALGYRKQKGAEHE